MNNFLKVLLFSFILIDNGNAASLLDVYEQALVNDPRIKEAFANKEAIIEALKTVYDPEIPVDIYELGLIYEINTELDGNVRLTMTLTAPGCPVACILPQEVADAAAWVSDCC